MKNIGLIFGIGISLLFFLAMFSFGKVVTREQQAKETCTIQCTTFIGTIDYVCATNCYEWEIK